MTDEIKKQLENIDNLNALAELVNRWDETDSYALFEYAAECNCDWFLICENKRDCITDGVHVLYRRESGMYDTFIMDYSKGEEYVASLIKAGVVFTTNADPAHTHDYPAMKSALLYWLYEYGFTVLNPGDTVYTDARAKLDLSVDYAESIYKIGEAFFAAC